MVGEVSVSDQKEMLNERGDQDEEDVIVVQCNVNDVMAEEEHKEKGFWLRRSNFHADSFNLLSVA